MKKVKIYTDKRRQKNLFNLFGFLFKLILDLIIPVCRNFIKDLKKFNMLGTGVLSVISLIIFDFVILVPCRLVNNFPLFVFYVILSTSIFCLWWFMILEPKNRAYNRMMWQKEEYWWQFDGWEFEEEVAKVFRAHGYKAKVTKGSGDGGVDIFLYKNGIKTVVQCKHYKEQVSPEPVRALWGCMYHFDADEAIFIASSGFTKGCYDFRMGKVNYIFMTLEDVIKMAGEV